EADGSAVTIELDHAIPLGIANLIAKNVRATLDGERVTIEVEFSIENVVAQNQRGAGVANKFRPDQECLGDSFRLRLLGVIDPNAELCAIAQIMLEHRKIFCRGI